MPTADDEQTVRLQPYQKRFSAIYSKGAEVLMRLAFSATGGLVVVLGLVATSDTLSPEFRVLACVLGLSAGLVAAVVAGVARYEANHTRRRVESLREEIGLNRDGYKMRLDSLTGAVMELTAIVRLQDAERPACDCAALSKRIDELTRDFAQSQVTQLHRRGLGRDRRSNGSGESDYS